MPITRSNFRSFFDSSERDATRAKIARMLYKDRMENLTVDWVDPALEFPGYRKPRGKFWTRHDFIKEMLHRFVQSSGWTLKTHAKIHEAIKHWWKEPFATEIKEIIDKQIAVAKGYPKEVRGCLRYKNETVEIIPFTENENAQHQMKAIEKASENKNALYEAQKYMNAYNDVWSQNYDTYFNDQQRLNPQPYNLPPNPRAGDYVTIADPINNRDNTYIWTGNEWRVHSQPQDYRRPLNFRPQDPPNFV